MDITTGATFPAALFKRAKTRVNQKINLPCDTKQHIREITINNGCNPHISIYCVRYEVEVLFSNEICSVD